MSDQKSMVQRLLIKLAEGLVIGLGASFAFYVISSMVDATDSLNNAVNRLETQTAVNDNFSDMLWDNLKETEFLKQESSLLREDLYKKMDLLSKRVQEIETAMKASRASINIKGFDYNLFKQTSVKPETDKQSLILPEAKKIPYNNLNELLKKQQSIPLKK